MAKTWTEEQQKAAEELIDSLVCVKGIVSKGRRKGSPYTLTTIRRENQFSSMLFKTAELAGVEVIDNTVDKE